MRGTSYTQLDCGCVVTAEFGHVHTKLCPTHFVMAFEDIRQLRRERAQTTINHPLPDMVQLADTPNGDLI